MQLNQYQNQKTCLVDVNDPPAGVLDVGPNGEVDEEVGAVAVLPELVRCLNPAEIVLLPVTSLHVNNYKSGHGIGNTGNLLIDIPITFVADSLNVERYLENRPTSHRSEFVFQRLEPDLLDQRLIHARVVHRPHLRTCSW